MKRVSWSPGWGGFYLIGGHGAKLRLFTSPRKERGEVKNDQPRRGHAAATASKSQLTISSVPPVGAAIGNRLCPANCRKLRSPANSTAATTKPKAAAMPIPA